MCEVTLMAISACGMDRAPLAPLLSEQPPTLLTPTHTGAGDRRLLELRPEIECAVAGPVDTLVMVDTILLVTTNQLLLVSSKQSVNVITTLLKDKKHQTRLPPHPAAQLKVCLLLYTRLGRFEPAYNLYLFLIWFPLVFFLNYFKSFSFQSLLSCCTTIIYC